MNPVPEGPAPHGPPGTPDTADGPPPVPEDELPVVAPQLRELRRRTGLTLEAAAARARMSPAHLSRLETGRRQPSLPMLLGLARTYGTTVSELLGETPAAADPIVRGGGAGAREADGWTYWQAGGSGRGMQALRVHIPYGRSQEELVRVHPGEEWLYVLKGRLRLHLGEAEYLLEAGDSAHFDSLTPHRIAAARAGGADLLFVHTLLQSAVSQLCLGGDPRRPKI
ncbi:helix-turn-helix domain-containing protein [Streptomyces sp. NRRL S-87]|uniref:helix-turn-helix domain-containing protein n=1 Tax=Streptomyces sp. NRRL S-87 TaxID=1463920 RepID=UPI00099CF012|nr:XRE family transcriptional regulator [Streptomyces sp. NRRL S-87]